MTPDERPSDVPYGYCWCGCGHKTQIATRSRRHITKGEPIRYINGHHTAYGMVRDICDPTTLTKCPTCGAPVHRRSTRRCDANHHALDTDRGRCGPCLRRPLLGSSGPAPIVEPEIVLQEWEHFGEALGWPPSRFAVRMGYSPDGLRRLLSRRFDDRHPGVMSFESAWEREFHTLPVVDTAAATKAHRAMHRVA